jgi:hypothetical protein
LYRYATGIDFDDLPPQVQAALDAGAAQKRKLAEKNLQKAMADPDAAIAGFEISHGMIGHDGELLDVAQMYAVERMQAAFRGFQARKRVRLDAEVELAQLTCMQLRLKKQPVSTPLDEKNCFHKLMPHYAEAKQQARGKMKAEAILNHVKALISEVEVMEERRRRGDGMTPGGAPGGGPRGDSAGGDLSEGDRDSARLSDYREHQR